MAKQAQPKPAASLEATPQGAAGALRALQAGNGRTAQPVMQGKASDEAATTTGTVTPRSVNTGATQSGRSSAGGLGSPGGSEGGGGGADVGANNGGDNGGSADPGGSGGSAGTKRRRGGTAGGAGVSRQELADMPTARVKRILANRQSAARSKERKLAYIGELESQVSTLTMQLTQASMQLRSLQQDTASLGECNQALAQQALVLREHMAQRDAETASLASELQRARALLAAHDIPISGPSERRSPYPNGMPSLAAGSASAMPSSGALLMAERMGVAAQAAAAAENFRGMPEGFGAPADGFRLPDGFAGGPGNAAALGSDLAQRAQLQAMERHQTQQRLWANSVGSSGDAVPGGSPGASPRAADAALLAAQQQLVAAAQAAQAANAAGRPAPGGPFLGGMPSFGAGLGAGLGSNSTANSLQGLSGIPGLGGGGGGSRNNFPSADTSYYPGGNS